MKTVKDTLLERRSIRRYEREPIPAETMDFIYEAIRNTPTSYNGQQFSVIDVTDQEVKEKIYELTQQKQAKTCAHFMLFCADYHKIRVIADRKDIDMPDFEHTLDGVIGGVVDATLAMMSALTAAEASGLGTCCIGYARTASPEAISRLLGLPKGVFVVCGLALGVPREHPDLKPKQPADVTIHSDRYNDEGLADKLVDYDYTVSLFNHTREGAKTDNDWASHIVDYYRQAMSYRMLDAIRRRGFDVES